MDQGSSAPLLPRLKSATLGERVADALRETIFRGAWAPGTELTQESLAEQFGVSRIPIREALQMLERDGLLHVHPNRRVTIAILNDEEIYDHYMVRALIEGEAAARAASRPARPEQLAELLASIEQPATRTAAGDQSELISWSKSFHLAVWELSGSNQLKVLAGQLWSGRDFTPEASPELIQKSSDDHVRIADAIKNRSVDEARNAMKEHLLSVAEGHAEYRRSMIGRPSTPG
jgi:DNA-binding GntR family transcriptional regulator